MLPSELSDSDFKHYPPQAREIATENLALLRRLPLAFLVIFLREVSSLDWKMPVERAQVLAQMRLLRALSDRELAEKMQGFAALRLNPELERSSWVDRPEAFVEQMTAWLWSTHQMDTLHGVAEAYSKYLATAAPAPNPKMPRLGIVVVGQGVPQTEVPLFRKLRLGGVYFSRIRPENGLEILLDHAASRAASAIPESADDAFSHWYIDGGTAAAREHLTTISYGALEQPRARLLSRMQETIASGSAGPEALRSLLAELGPSDVGLSDGPSEAVLNRFQLSLLTEGSGTQIFSTTFVQWGARECLRRAQPETIVLRYAPRQRVQPMNRMLSGAPIGGLDPEGSLIDADMGAYYTWINLSRLPGADQARFLVWFEDQRQAVAIGPGMPRGASSDSAMNMKQLLDVLS